MFSFNSDRVVRKWCLIAAASVVAPLFTVAAGAVTVQNGNSSLIINPATDNTTAWIVEGVNQYGSGGGEQFFYSIGNTAPQPLVTSEIFNTGGFYTATGSGPGFTVSVNETLTGGNSGTGGSGLVESIAIQNTTDGTMDFRVYEFNAFNLNSVPGNNTLTLSGGNTANQTDPFGTVATVSVTPLPSYYQGANDATIRNELTSGSGVTLTDGGTGPLFGTDSFAAEWEQDLAATDGSMNVSVTESITGGEVIPLPNAAASALAMLTVLAGVGLIRRTRKLVPA